MIFTADLSSVWLIIKYRIFTVTTLRVELHDSGYTENHDFFIFLLNRDHDYLTILNKTK